MASEVLARATDLGHMDTPDRSHSSPAETEWLGQYAVQARGPCSASHRHGLGPTSCERILRGAGGPAA